LKAVCAFFVVSIHFSSFYKIEMRPLLWTAVPVFFIITGYFLYSADRNVALTRCKKALRKLLVLYLWSNALYLTYRLAIYFRHGFFPIDSWRNVVDFLIFGEEFCIALWYLTACLQTLIVFWAALKFKLERWLYPIIPVGLLFALLFGSYCFHDYPLPHPLVRSAFTTGMPCFLLGWLTHRYADRLTMRRIELTLLMLTGLYYVEYLCYIKFVKYLMNPLSAGDLIVLTVPTAWLLFLCVLKHKDFGAGSPLERIGRDHSTNIYILHFLVGWLLTPIIVHFCPMLSALISPQIAAITVFAATLATSVCLKYLHRSLKGRLSLKNI